MGGILEALGKRHSEPGENFSKFSSSGDMILTVPCHVISNLPHEKEKKNWKP